MGFPSSALRVSGQVRKFTSKAANGGDAVRNSCPVCGSLVFGGELGKDQMFTIYAGSLDDPSWLKVGGALYTASAQPWAHIDETKLRFEKMPPGAP